MTCSMLLPISLHPWSTGRGRAMWLLAFLVASVCLVHVPHAHGHVGGHPPVEETVGGILQRMHAELPLEKLPHLTPAEAAAFMDEEEKHILETDHLTFRVNVPVRVSVIKDARLGGEPFWLEERGFAKAAYAVHTDAGEYEVWQRDFRAGFVGLGVNSLSGTGDHYFVALRSLEEGVTPEVRGMDPARPMLGVVRDGERAYACANPSVIVNPPAELAGDVLIRGDNDLRLEGKVTGVFQATDHPASPAPDQIVLTWNADPRSTQTVQWRTSVDAPSGAVRYQKAPAEGSADTDAWQVAHSVTTPLETPRLVNDPLVTRHTAVLRGLEPDTAYRYQVGHAGGEAWVGGGTFRTAPASADGFSFVYVSGPGDGDLPSWRARLDAVEQAAPAAGFHVLAGDIVGRLNERSGWDALFAEARGVFEHRPLVPALGGAEQRDGMGPWVYLAHFALPENGPPTIPTRRAYSFEYADALFVVLDGTLPPDTQDAWLDARLARSDAPWKFVVYHRPAGDEEDCPLRALWGPILERHSVDLVLEGQGHVHAPQSGAQFGLYPAWHIAVDGDRLILSAFDEDGSVDERFEIRK